MNLTERAILVMDIARRIKSEQAVGRSVDPSRLAWADFIVAANAPHERLQRKGIKHDAEIQS